MSTSGGKFLDEMRLLEAYKRSIEAMMEGEQWKYEEAEEVMPELHYTDKDGEEKSIKPTYSLLTSTGALGYIGAKKPPTERQLQEAHKDVMRLIALLNIGYPMDKFRKALERMKVKYSFLQFKSRREPPVAHVDVYDPTVERQEEFERKSDSRLRRFGSWAKRQIVGDEDE